jgi:CxxC motif-containing protein
MAVRELICINCPRGCHLSVDENLVVTGNFCPRGAAYGKQEVTNPTRTLTSTVRISGAELPLCPVKTSTAIPKGKMFDAMKEIDLVHLNAPVHIGDVVIKDLAKTGISLVVTRDMEKI